MKLDTHEIMGAKVFVENMVLGKVVGFIIDTADGWNVTHLELRLSRKGAKNILGAAKFNVRNSLAISALGDDDDFMDDDGIKLKISKAQANSYLRPIDH